MPSGPATCPSAPSSKGFEYSSPRMTCSSPRKEKHSKPQQGKSKRNPQEESPGISNPREDPSWRQKEVIPRCQRENFVPTKFEIQIWVSNFMRRVEYSRIWRDGFPFCTARFSSDPTKWKVDRHCYDFKLKFKTQVIYADTMLSTNALSVFILHHHVNLLCKENLCSIQ